MTKDKKIKNTQIISNKGFLQFFWTTLKNSKMLLLKYVITAVLLTISTLFANKLQLAELSYFNGVCTIMYFSGIFSFGIGVGLSVFINQNKNNEEKVVHYVKFGFYLTILFGIIFCILIAVFKDFIFTKIMNLNMTDGGLFYYYMLPAIFFGMIFDYFIKMYVYLEKFNYMLLVSSLQSITMVICFMLIYFYKSLNLGNIALIYNISYLLCIIIALIIFGKAKTNRVNLFKIEKKNFTLNKKEWKTIFFLGGKEVVWEIGYFCLSLFLVKISEGIFNTYSYYENVLDIFNGLLFAFLNITQIEICKQLGKNHFGQAYKTAKYSIWSSMLIWVIYFLLSFCLFIPITNGINVEIRQLGKIVFFLYIFIHLFRFLSWNLASYILCCGGEGKIIFALEILASAYYVVLYFVGGLLPNNVYLAYFLISVDSIIKIPICLVIFYRKKWLINVKTGKHQIERLIKHKSIIEQTKTGTTVDAIQLSKEINTIKVNVLKNGNIAKIENKKYFSQNSGNKK